MKIKKILPRVKAQLGFTMIELLIVISILGILAVAVLSAINPIEQINRGRDTGTRSDAEQLLSAIDRYYAYKGYYPWEVAPTSEAVAFTQVTDTWSDGGTTDCGVLDKISNGSVAGVDGATVTCDGTNELKRSFVEKVVETDYNPLNIYYSGADGASTYVCFDPRSASFNEEASDRCGDDAAGLPSDLAGASTSVCPDDDEDAYMVCLP